MMTFRQASMDARLVLMSVVALAGLVLSTPASAATCTVKGKVYAQLMDTYFCKSSKHSCTDWRERDLDWGSKPLKNLVVALQTTLGDTLAVTSTNINGDYSLTTNHYATCSGTTAHVVVYYMRANPAPGTWPVFFIGGPGPTHAVHARSTATTMTGSTHTQNISHPATATPNLWSRLGTLYYTLNSAVDEMRTWSARVNHYIGGGSGGSFVVEFHVNNHYSNAWLPWGVQLGYERFAWGGNTRHELGHLVHMAIHDRKMNLQCYSMDYNNAPIHGEWSCEYGMTATHEGMATFFAVRSLVGEGSNENSAFFCYGADSNDYTQARHFCSNVATASYFMGTPGDVDRMMTVLLSNPPPPGSPAYGSVIGVGDTFAESTNRCTRQEPASCACADTQPPLGECDGNFHLTNGWRTETNVYRFLWDLIDGNNDAGGTDDDNFTIAGLVAELEAMPCTGLCDGSAQEDCGVDGTCNEPNAPTCYPVFHGYPWQHFTGDRDSYNTTDLDTVITGVQWHERELNCLHQAPDL